MDCENIRALLPLYEDNAASQETQELVRKHLADCPDCRQELRKMRTPISLPPSEDEEAVKRFLEYRAEVRKKQNVKIACVVSVLAVLIGFILCYTLIPRSWDSLSKGAEADRIMAHYILFTIDHDGTPGADIWTLDEEHETDSAVIRAVMEILRAGSYRAELRNVMNHTPFAPLFQDTSVKGFSGTIDVNLVKNNNITATIHLYGTPDHKVHIYTGDNSNTFFYHTDGKTFDALAELM